MSKEAAQEREFEGITWEETLEDDTLATVQAKLENEFGAEFSDQDFERKGFSSDGLPFYTGVSTEFDIWTEGETEPVDLEVERDGEMNSVRYFANSGAAMIRLQEYLTSHSRESKGEMLEPYEIKDVQDTEALRVLQELEDRYDLEGPERNPKAGETRIYPVRIPHLRETEPEGEKQDQTGEESHIIDDSGIYSPQNHHLPGEAQFQVKGKTPETSIDATLRIIEQRDHEGLYKIEIDADLENQESQTEIAYTVDRVLNER